ncbi:G-box binding factor 3 [Euphorbia peplus]|nr:G-box binding factor 3 [Euphorbia peplus]
MGNSEEGKSSKPENPSSPAPPDQTNVHVYPDWAAMQAYYGPRVPMAPYYNSAMASGHTPHPHPYMWGPPPQHMMAPYGAPYGAVYPHGGVYAHHAVPIGSHPHAPGVPSTPVAVTPAETPAKSATSTDRGLMKKLKGFDGLAMSIGNVNSNPESAEGGDCRLSQSTETEGCSDGSDGSSVGKKRSRQGTPNAVGEGKIETGSSVATGDTTPSSDKAGFGYTGALGKGHVVSPSTNAAKINGASAAQPCQVLPPETWLHNEREIKRERRKQSNRESARRSRLRKQAETEELAHRVESLISENSALKSEVGQLNEKSEKLRLENAALLEKLKNKQMGHTQGPTLKGSDEKRMAAVSTENLLSSLNNSVSVDRRNTGEEGETYESSRNPNSGAKLHQLLGTSPSPRADAVAAG